MDVPELERGAGGLVEEDHEEGDEREPELGRAQLASAAPEHLREFRTRTHNKNKIKTSKVLLL